MADEEEGEVDQIPRLDFAAWRKKREEAKAIMAQEAAAVRWTAVPR